MLFAITLSASVNLHHLVCIACPMTFLLLAHFPVQLAAILRPVRFKKNASWLCESQVTELDILIPACSQLYIHKYKQQYICNRFFEVGFLFVHAQNHDSTFCTHSEARAISPHFQVFGFRGSVAQRGAERDQQRSERRRRQPMGLPTGTQRSATHPRLRRSECNREARLCSAETDSSPCLSSCQP